MRAFPVLMPKEIQYLLRDDFSDTRAAGAVNGTPATPGPGVRTATDTESKITVASNKLTVSGGKASAASGDPGIWLDSLTRSAGIMMMTHINASVLSLVRAGWAGGASGAPNQNAIALNGSNLQSYDNSVAITHGSTATSTNYYLLSALRTTGACHFAKIETGNFLLLWLSAAANTATIYPAIANFNAVFVTDFVRVPADRWLPTPLASDGFGSSFGTADGLGHAEGVAGGIGSGGGGLSWTQQVGTWGTSGGKAVATALTGGVAIATVPLSSANVFAGVAITRTANSVGPVVRYVDADNYVYAVHDGTNSKLVKRVAGTETVLVNVAATYSANASLIIDCNGTAFRLYYNNTLSGTSTISDSVLQSSALAGIITKDAGNTLDNFVVMAKGTEGQYSTLNQYTV